MMKVEKTRYSGVWALIPTVVVQVVAEDGKLCRNVMLLWLSYGLSFQFGA